MRQHDELSMLRSRLSDALKAAMKNKDERRVSTLRLILAALKDRDIAARSDAGKDGAVGEDDILHMLQTMVRQRRESIDLYEKGNRPELAQKEREEIEVIENFLPQQLSDEEVANASRSAIEECAATGLKDMGRIMATLRQRYPGQMDFAKCSKIVKEMLQV
tara:strand:+ start:70 stop:555 length:486 start_codon:yes stop_codon:yes gene_type:complete